MELVEVELVDIDFQVNAHLILIQLDQQFNAYRCPVSVQTYPIGVGGGGAAVPQLKDGAANPGSNLQFLAQLLQQVVEEEKNGPAGSGGVGGGG